MNVLSLFDGMSCGQQALGRAGFVVDNYYASEIDKHAIKVTMANYPNTIQLGSVLNVNAKELPKIDLLIGGSPCQSFSFAGKRKGMSTKDNIEVLTLEHYLELKSQNFEFEGQSYLFWEYMRILQELRAINPDIYFLLENVEMGEKWEKILSKAIGLNGIHINSALVSAQNRKRIYWTNIGLKPRGLFGDLESIIEQPKDRGILLKDILEDEVDEKYYLSSKMLDYLNSRKANFNAGKINYKTENDVASCISASPGLDISDNIIIDPNRKARCFTADGNSGGLHSQMDLIVHNMMPRNSKSGKGGTGHLSRNDGKKYCLDTNTNTNAIELPAIYDDYNGNIRKDGKTCTLTINSGSKAERNGQKVILPSVQKDNLPMLNDNQKKKFDFNPNTDKAGCLTLAQGRAGSSDEYMDSVSKIAKIQGNIRRLTPIECERLQTVKDNEINCIFALCLDQIKNYVDAVNQNPKLQKLVLNAEKTELNEIVKSVLLNMNVSSRRIKHIAHQSVDMRTQKETNQCINHNQQENNIIASNVDASVMCNCLSVWEGSVQKNVFINITEGRITHFGQEELLQKDKHFTIQENGESRLNLCGKEIMQLVKNVDVETTKQKDMSSIYTTLFRLNTKSLEQALIIYYLFAKNVIIGYTQNTTQVSNLLLNFKLTNGYTNHVSDSQRYKMLGNGWNIETIVHILSYLNK